MKRTRFSVKRIHNFGETDSQFVETDYVTRYDSLINCMQLAKKVKCTVAVVCQREQQLKLLFLEYEFLSCNIKICYRNIEIFLGIRRYFLGISIYLYIGTIH